MPYKNKEKAKQFYKKNYIKHREYKLKKQKEYNSNHLDEISKRMKQYYRDNKEKKSQYDREYRKKNRERLNEYRRKYLKKIRREVISYYSNGKFECVYCGEKHYEFLTIDHIHNNGSEHRKNMKSSNIYLELKKERYPNGYRVLCYNCNISKGLYGYSPYCPYNSKDNE